MAFQDAFIALSKHPDLPRQPLRVLMYLFGRLDWENFIAVSQVEVARELGMAPSHVSAAMKRLQETGILLPGPKVGRSSTYRLNHAYGWKGRVRNLETTRRAHLRVISSTDN